MIPENKQIKNEFILQRVWFMNYLFVSFFTEYEILQTPPPETPISIFYLNRNYNLEALHLRDQPLNFESKQRNTMCTQLILYHKDSLKHYIPTPLF